MAQIEVGPDAARVGERGGRPHVSLVLPVFNEEATVREVYRRSADALEEAAYAYEIIVVDDGSTDRTWAELEAIHREDPNVRAIRFKRNFGQHPAMHAGIVRARGDVVVTMDADLQNNPHDIVRLGIGRSFQRINIFPKLTVFQNVQAAIIAHKGHGSRLWGRSAIYHSGGAYCFRDQLQDAMAALYVDSRLTRKQILLHSSKQFKMGDVLHWWHPPVGRGVRSRISDDRLWLPYVTLFYIDSTGDESVLREKTPYISARTLEEYEHEAYLIPELMKDRGTVYEHCCRAIDVTLRFGKHGLPLMGSGDWNDGMNRVGEEGKGESVWLGFFIYDILERFRKICSKVGDEERASDYKKFARRLKDVILPSASQL
jgi:glycosyltransferase involved in cell wall biosynthesis